MASVKNFWSKARFVYTLWVQQCSTDIKLEADNLGQPAENQTDCFNYSELYTSWYLKNNRQKVQVGLSRRSRMYHAINPQETLLTPQTALDRSTRIMVVIQSFYKTKTKLIAVFVCVAFIHRAC
jgi:hypothetical protein